MNLDNGNIKNIKKILHEIELINLTLNEVEAVENDTCKLELKGKMTFIALLSRRAQLVAQHHYGLSEDQEISKSVIQLSELQVKQNSLHKRIKEESKE